VRLFSLVLDAIKRAWVSGAGAFVSPFVATQFINQPHWSYLYMVPLIIASLNLVLLFMTFGFHTQQGSLDYLTGSSTTIDDGLANQSFLAQYSLLTLKNLEVTNESTDKCLDPGLFMQWLYSPFYMLEQKRRWEVRRSVTYGYCWC
jgi:hypothetical protein